LSHLKTNANCQTSNVCIVYQTNIMITQGVVHSEGGLGPYVTLIFGPMFIQVQISSDWLHSTETHSLLTSTNFKMTLSSYRQKCAKYRDVYTNL